eukprot:scaffold15306_cov207-Alexandrium_tamarense.AAC.1
MSSTAKKSSSKASSSTPKTLLDKIVHAIRATPPTNTNGISRTSIAKYLQSEYSIESKSSQLKNAFKKGVDKGVLLQTGQSFRVKGDKIDLPEEVKICIEEIEEGNGQAAQHGDTVVVKYRGTLASDGEEFDKASSFEFTLGAGEVIKGWDLGIKDMKVGGKRKLRSSEWEFCRSEPLRQSRYGSSFTTVALTLDTTTYVEER